jgi:hypothetical protein
VLIVFLQSFVFVVSRVLNKILQKETVIKYNPAYHMYVKALFTLVFFLPFVYFTGNLNFDGISSFSLILLLLNNTLLFISNYTLNKIIGVYPLHYIVIPLQVSVIPSYFLSIYFKTSLFHWGIVPLLIITIYGFKLLLSCNDSENLTPFYLFVIVFSWVVNLVNSTIVFSLTNTGGVNIYMVMLIHLFFVLASAFCISSNKLFSFSLFAEYFPQIVTNVLLLLFTFYFLSVNVFLSQILVLTSAVLTTLVDVKKCKTSFTLSNAIGLFLITFCILGLSGITKF